jgi:flagellar basal body-associated protein FliL
VKKQKSSGVRNILIILTGLVFAAVMVAGVAWWIWSKKTNTIVAQGSAAQRMKIPLAQSQMGHVQHPLELPQTKVTANPVILAVKSDPSPSQEVMEVYIPTHLHITGNHRNESQTKKRDRSQTEETAFTHQ